MKGIWFFMVGLVLGWALSRLFAVDFVPYYLIFWVGATIAWLVDDAEKYGSWRQAIKLFWVNYLWYKGGRWMVVVSAIMLLLILL